MFNIGFSEVLVILIVALLVVGPKELPQVAKSLAKAINSLKKSKADLERAILDDSTESPADQNDHVESKRT